MNQMWNLNVTVAGCVVWLNDFAAYDVNNLALSFVQTRWPE